MNMFTYVDNTNKDLKTDVEKQRIVWADVTRTIAIFCVVLCHAVGKVYPFDLDSIMKLSPQARLLAHSLLYIGRLGVPFFLILTGYFLLSRDFSFEYSKKFWKHKCLPLLITTEIWIFLYWVFQCFQTRSIDFLKLFYELLFLRYTDINHLWYLPMILGIYIFIPFISKAIKLVPNNILWIIISGVVLYCFIVPFINNILLLNGLSGVSSILYLEYSGEAYGVYLIIGYLISDNNFQFPSSLLFVLSAVNFLLAIFTQDYFYVHGFKYTFWYDSVFVFFGTILLLLILIRIPQTIKMERIFTTVSIYSFPVYLIHNMILELLYLGLPVSIDRVFKFLIIYSLTMGLSLLLVVLLSNSKIIKKYFFLIK